MKDSTNDRSWLTRLGFSTGMTVGLLGAPEQINAGPITVKKTSWSQSDWDINASADKLRKVFTEAPLIVENNRLVVDRSHSCDIKRINDALKPLGTPRQDFICKAMLLSVYGGDTDTIPRDRLPVSLAKRLNGIFDPNSSALATQEQLKKMAAAASDYHTELAQLLTPPLPPQTTRPRKSNPPTFVMCSPACTKDQPISFLYKDYTQRFWTWHAIKQSLEAAGANVAQIDGRTTKETTNRQIYVTNPVFYMVHQKTAYVPLKNSSALQLKEQPALIDGFVRRGIKTVMVDANFNAGNMFAYPPANPKVLVVGSVAGSKETTSEDTAALEAATGMKVETIPMSLAADPDWKVPGSPTPFYDLDCFCTPLPKGEILYYPGGTTKEGEKNLLKLAGGADHLIAIGREDALNFATNLNVVEDGEGVHTLVMPSCSPELLKELTARGYNIVCAETLGITPDKLRISDGSIHCMALAVGENFPNFPEKKQLPPIDVWLGGKRKRPEDHIEIETADGKTSIPLADLLGLRPDLRREMF